MTAGLRERKQMWVADVVLRRAARLLPVTLETPAVPTDLDSIDVPAARAQNVANLDRLATLGRGRDLRGGFWRDLLRAGEMLEVPDRMVELTSQYRAALERVGPAATRSTDPGADSGPGRGVLVTEEPQRATLWLEFEHWVTPPDEDRSREFFNMTVTYSDGSRYALNVWTYGYFELACAEAASEPNTLGGRFIEPPDLFVELMDRPLLEQVVATLIANGRMRPEWRVPDETADEAG